MTPPARSAALWVAVLLAAAAAVVAGAVPARARTTPPAGFCPLAPCPTNPTSTTTTTTVAPTTSSTSTTTSTTSTTVAPTTVPNSPYAVGFVPCGSAAGGPCRQEPDHVEVHYSGTAPAALQMAWVSAGRAAGAPAPAAATATLMWSDGAACGSNLRCWPWPAAITDSGQVLNGTYQMQVCDTYTQGSCQSTASKVSVGLAAPPGPPTKVQAGASASVVTVTWAAPDGAPPDLAGYTVARNGRSFFSCSTDGLGPGSARCPAPLRVTDRPGNGTFSYVVTAVRLGADTKAQDLVSSSPAGAGSPVAVPGQATAAGQSDGFGHAGSAGIPAPFTPSPVIGGAGGQSGAGSPVPVLPGGTSGDGGSAETGAAGTPANLQYPSGATMVGAPPMKASVEEGGGGTDVVPTGVLGLAVLILAIAAHFLYLRSELGLVQARLSAARKRQE